MNNLKVSSYEYKTTRKLKSGEIRTYTQKTKYVKKGSLFTNFINKYNDIINNKDLKPVDKLYKLYDVMTADEKKQYSTNQIRNLIYRHLKK